MLYNIIKLTKIKILQITGLLYLPHVEQIQCNSKKSTNVRKSTSWEQSLTQMEVRSIGQIHAFL
jgi:hypothetical protein